MDADWLLIAAESEADADLWSKSVDRSGLKISRSVHLWSTRRVALKQWANDDCIIINSSSNSSTLEKHNKFLLHRHCGDAEAGDKTRHNEHFIVISNHQCWRDHRSETRKISVVGTKIFSTNSLLPSEVDFSSLNKFRALLALVDLSEFLCLWHVVCICICILCLKGNCKC